MKGKKRVMHEVVLVKARVRELEEANAALSKRGGPKKTISG